MAIFGLGGDIRSIRKKLGLTQEELAKEFGLSRSFMGQLERNERPLPERYFSRLIKLAASSK
jgi:transcriptional regulator with XRE-family HTH domain